MYCAGNATAPVTLPPLCDLVQSCGEITAANEMCETKQSTFWQYRTEYFDYAVDQDPDTCIKTADAKLDSNPQYVRVDLETLRLIGTVRFLSTGAASNFSVVVSQSDAAFSSDDPANPSQGAALPDVVEACTVKATATSGVFEAECDAAVKGQFVFISRTSAGESLEVCDVEVFGHKCMAAETVSCPYGYEPSSCTEDEALCRGCVPCQAGTYSDKEGDYQCTPCPGEAAYGERPYSPPGSTSVFQCEGDQHLDGTSTLAVERAEFNQTDDSWVIDIEYTVAPKIVINGLSTLYMSLGGEFVSQTNAGGSSTWDASNFPCRADASRGAGSDVSASLSETVCCLQDLRADYLLTDVFRKYSDGLDLVAANDKCDAEDGSDMLKYADIPVVPEEGTIFVDQNGNGFGKSIRVVMRNSTEMDGQTTYHASIIIPDAELFKVSRTLNPDGNLTDSRELFIGLFDMLPTGTRVVDTASQQISVVLTRTQYGTFAAYGTQNIDYDFISFLNARVYEVKNKGALFQPQMEMVGYTCEDYVQWEKGWNCAGPYSRIFSAGGPGNQVRCADSTVDECNGINDRDHCSQTRPPVYPSVKQCQEKLTTAHFAEVTFVWDDRLDAASEQFPVVEGSVRINIDPNSIEGQYYNQLRYLLDSDSYEVAFPSLYGVREYNPCFVLDAKQINTIFLPLVSQECGPSVFPESTLESVTDIQWPHGNEITLNPYYDPIYGAAGPVKNLYDGGMCPQVTIPDDHFGKIYIPFDPYVSGSTLKIGFDLNLKDKDGRNASMHIDMTVVADDFSTYCDSDEGSVNLAERVVPSIIVGTESSSPPRLQGWPAMNNGDDFTSEAETLQDGLVSLLLELDETQDVDNLEVFFEDVVVIHVNPGSQPDVGTIKDAITGEDKTYMPTYEYDPDERDAWIIIPDKLKEDCPAEDATTSFFGCVHKHILRDKVITNGTDAYMVGSSLPPAAGAQDFVETMLGDGTASVAARELGRDFESYLVGEGVTGSNKKKIGLWINPGHKWGGVTANSEYSLSNHLIIYVLFGVRSGVDGSERRMLLQAGSDGSTSLVKTIQYQVSAGDLVEKMLDNVVAVEVEATLPLSAEEACFSPKQLLAMCADRLEAAVKDHASSVENVQCLSVRVENANCGGARRATSDPYAVVAAVVALEDTADAFLDMPAVVASGAVLSMKQTAGRPMDADGKIKEPTESGMGDDKKIGGNDDKDTSEKDSGSSNDITMIAGAAGAAAGVVILALVVYTVVKKRRGGAHAPLTEVVSTGVPMPRNGGSVDKSNIESILFAVEENNAQGAQAGASAMAGQDLSLASLVKSDSRKQLLTQ